MPPKNSKMQKDNSVAPVESSPQVAQVVSNSLEDMWAMMNTMYKTTKDNLQQASEKIQKQNEDIKICQKEVEATKNVAQSAKKIAQNAYRALNISFSGEGIDRLFDTNGQLRENRVSIVVGLISQILEGTSIPQDQIQRSVEEVYIRKWLFDKVKVVIIKLRDSVVRSFLNNNSLRLKAKNDFQLYLDNDRADYEDRRIAYLTSLMYHLKSQGIQNLRVDKYSLELKQRVQQEDGNYHWEIYKQQEFHGQKRKRETDTSKKFQPHKSANTSKDDGTL